MLVGVIELFSLPIKEYLWRHENVLGWRRAEAVQTRDKEHRALRADI